MSIINFQCPEENHGLVNENPCSSIPESELEIKEELPAEESMVFSYLMAEAANNYNFF
jgi:hypothetical protein